MLLFALLRHQVNYIGVPDTPGTSSFLSFFVFLCFYLSFQLLSSQCCQAVGSASCWGHIRLCEQRLKRFSAERLLWKDLVTLVELQEAEIRNNSFLWRWEGEICYLFWQAFIVLASCQFYHLWTVRTLFQVSFFPSFFFFNGVASGSLLQPNEPSGPSVLWQQSRTCPSRVDTIPHGLKPNKMHTGWSWVNNTAAAACLDASSLSCVGLRVKEQ